MSGVVSSKNTKGGRARTPAPSSEVVRAELVELRQYQGISIMRLRDFAPALQTLEATKAELARRALSPSDTAVAAYHVVRCAIDFLILRPDLARILLHTLNFAQEATLLTKRREDVRREFYWSPKTYERLEEEAYVQLAGELVAAESTPCLEPWRPPEDRRPVKIEMSLTVEQTEDLRYLLTLFSVDHRHRVQNEVARRILDRLPNARHDLRVADPAFGLEEDRSLVRVLIALSALTFRKDRHGRHDEMADRKFDRITQLMLSEIDPELGDAVLARAEDLLEAESDSVPTLGYYTMKADTISELADWMTVKDTSTSGWRDVTGFSRQLVLVLARR